MARLEDLPRGASVGGILPDGLVTVVDVQWFGWAVIVLTYKDAGGRLGNELVYRDREPTLEIVTVGHPGRFDGPRTAKRSASPITASRRVRGRTTGPAVAVILS